MLGAAALFSGIVVLPFLLRPGSEIPAAFEVEVVSDTSGLAQIFCDIGHGFREADSATTSLPSGDRPVHLRFPLPIGSIRAIRFDPIDRPGHLNLRGARITDQKGKIVHRFFAADFRAERQISSLDGEGDTVRMATTPGANDPVIGLVLPQPLVVALPSIWAELSAKAWPVFGVLAAGLLAGSFLPAGVRARVNATARAAWTVVAARPALALALAAGSAVALSSYPVIFLGRSFVSPNFSDGTHLLYEQFPTLPGYQDGVTANAQGSDVGAILWQQVPYSFVQHRALLRDGELPLWNRYNSGGSPLLGQGQSMFGDPLHFLVIVANGAAWAWDLKYLLAKWLLCLGLGLTVWRLTRHLPAAILSALAGAFLGFFHYRVNHPAFFSFCYAPWILYGWAGLATAATWRSLAGGCAALLVINSCELPSGTVKEAYLLLLGLNLSGVFLLAFATRPWRDRAIALAAAAWTGVLFVLLTAPTWLTFLDTLRQAYTTYNTPAAFQISPSVALGFFDEIFYRPLIQGHRVFNPSANFLVLAGVLYFMAAFRHAASRPARALAWSALLPAALAFGLVPPQWIIRVPFLANVAHIDNCFSCVLIILAVVIAGFGWKAAFERLATPEGRGDLVRVGGWFALLAAPWIALTHTVHRPLFGDAKTFTFLRWGEPLPVPAFVWGSLLALVLAMAVLLLTLRRSLAHRQLDATGGLLLTLALLVLLWRHGLQARAIGPADYVFTPAVRADFQASSPAVTALLADQSEPARTVGFGNNLFPGWSGCYDLEGIGGADGLASPYFRELTDSLGVERIWDWRLYLTEERLAASKPALDFLNVRYYLDLHGDRRHLGTLLTPVATADLDVYRSETAWPRAFFSDQVVPYDTPAQLGEKARQPGVQPFAAVFRADLPTLPPGIAVASLEAPPVSIRRAHDYQLSNRTTTFTIEASGAGLAVLEEAWWPASFQATLNGEKARLVRVNHAFKGVVIPTAGTYRVTVSYQPPRFPLAWGLAGGGLALLAASGVFVRGRWSRRLGGAPG